MEAHQESPQPVLLAFCTAKRRKAMRGTRWANNLGLWRRYAGWARQVDAAPELGLPRGTLAAYEAGRELPALEEVLAIVDKLRERGLDVPPCLIWPNETLYTILKAGKR